MAIPEMFMALPVVLLWQLPWIAALVFALLIYRRRRSPGARLAVLALGLLILLAVAVPLFAPGAWARVTFIAPRDDWYTLLAVKFLGNLASLTVVLFLGMALYWLMKDLVGSGAREQASNDASSR